MPHKVKAKCGRLTYDRCEQIVGSAHSRVIANNTWLHRCYEGETLPPSYCLELHHHPILRFYSGGVVVLDSCGYRTTTTKARLNQFGPVQVWSKNHTWLVAWPHGGDVPFHDGLIVFDDGTPLDWLRQSVPLRPDTELGIVADYLDEQGRDADAARVRAVVIAGLEV